MPKNYWMVVQTPEEFSVSNDRGFDIHGLRYTYKKRARRIEPDDCVLVYVSGIRKWTATCTFTSRYFEDRQPIWNLDGTEDQYPLRVHMSPAIVLDEADYIDALQIGPRLEYVKRWIPEHWPLAFVETLHLLPQRDFRLIEGEMKRITSKHGRGQNKVSKDENGSGDDKKNQGGDVGTEEGQDRNASVLHPTRHD